MNCTRRCRSHAAVVPVLLVLFAGSAPLAAQEGQTASIVGTTTSQGGAVLLPGVHVVILDATTGEIVGETDTDDHGAFRFTTLRPGSYRVRATLDQFQDVVTKPLQLLAGQQARVSLDLALVRNETLVVTPEMDVPLSASSLPSRAVQADDIRSLQPVNPADVQSMLTLVPGAIRGPGGMVAINGGRPSQTRVQIDNTTIIDPTTGAADIDIPSDAIASMQVMPNPVAGEFGRLSAGLIQFHTRPAPNQRRFTISNFVPEPRFRNGLHLYGIRDFAPRLFAGGPIVKSRLFVAESLSLEYYRPRVFDEARDGPNTTTRERLDSFTRLDWSMSANHFATLNFGAFPKNTDRAFIGHFVPPEASPNERDRPYLLSASERATFGAQAVLESTIGLRDFSVEVSGNAPGPQVITPAGQSGSFFSTQHRRMRTVQWKETFDLSITGSSGEHFLKVGTDAMAGAYEGSNGSRPVELRRLDGTPAERITFATPSSQSANGIDIGVFAADSWKPTPRVSIEPSARIDYDGVFRQVHVAPRVASAFGLNSRGTAAIRAGVGQFYERAPLLVPSFVSFDAPTITRFAADGVTPAAPPTAFSYAVAPGLQTPSAFIWNVGYDQKLSADWLVSASALERTGSHELIVQPVTEGPRPQIVLSSTGRSVYRELSLWAQYQHKTVHASISYVWSHARGDLNPIEAFFGTFRNPIIRPNEYGPTSLDMPHRVIAWWSTPIGRGFGLAGTLETRTGYAYSAVDENQAFIGPRNSLRFPHYTTLDVSAFRETQIGSHRVRLIVRVYNVLSKFRPTEVQNNVAAPDFGTFYSHDYRRLALDFDVLR